jgi:hypothetical protein
MIKKINNFIAKLFKTKIKNKENNQLIKEKEIEEECINSLRLTGYYDMEKIK